VSAQPQPSAHVLEAGILGIDPLQFPPRLGPAAHAVEEHRPVIPDLAQQDVGPRRRSAKVKVSIAASDSRSCTIALAR
jgi:hypothetical protein